MSRKCARIFGLIAVLIAAILVAGAETQVKLVNVERTPANDGAHVYGAYCASCHGEEGRGDGAIAAALNPRPSDLTKLRRMDDGRFPSLRVMNAILGETCFASRNDRDMPPWARVFHELDRDQGLKMLRVSNLVAHVESLQQIRELPSLAAKGAGGSGSSSVK